MPSKIGVFLHCKDLELSQTRKQWINNSATMVKAIPAPVDDTTIGSATSNNHGAEYIESCDVTTLPGLFKAVSSKLGAAMMAAAVQI